MQVAHKWWILIGAKDPMIMQFDKIDKKKSVHFLRVHLVNNGQFRSSRPEFLWSV